MLIASILVLGIAAAIGMVLASLYLLVETPPTTRWVAPLHGAIGAAGLAVLILALRGPGRGASMSGGAFGLMSGGMLGVTFLGGLLILILNLRRRAVPTVLIALHATIGIAGYVLLTAYFTMPASRP